ncbi:hypothetical protein KUV33_22090 [Leisingera daeponensis]|nr:hypothetical protein [Leisingera daeponensis]
MVKMQDRWFIRFESGGFLSRSKMGITYFGNNALIFASHEEAEKYFFKNVSVLEETGLRPSLARITSSE